MKASSPHGASAAPATADGPRYPIALLINDLSSGGAQRRIVSLANRFTELGRAVDVVVVDPRGPIRELLSPAVKIVVLASNGALTRLTPAIYSRSLASYLRREEPIVLMSCVTGTHLLAVMASRTHRRKVPLVLRVSRHPYRSFRRFKAMNGVIESIKLKRTSWRYARADAIVAISADCADGVRRLLKGRPVRVETILNPVVTATLLDAPEMRRRAPKRSEPLVLGVGRMVAQKDFATLLRAFAIVREERAARLVLLGDGELRQDLQRLARRLGIAAHVEMPGEVCDVSDWMRRADLVVSSSQWEGLQATLIEALAVGCPVVATDCPGGARETLEDGQIGLLVPICDPAAMAQAMMDQLDCPPDPMLLAKGASRFTAIGKAERYLSLFDSVRPQARPANRARRPAARAAGRNAMISTQKWQE